MEYRINQALIIQRGVPERNRQHFRILDPEAGDKLDDVGPCFGRVAEALKSWQQLGDHLGRVDVRLGADPESTLEEDVQPGRAPKSKQATQNISEPMSASTKMRLSFSPPGPSVSAFVPPCFATRSAHVLCPLRRPLPSSCFHRFFSFLSSFFSASVPELAQGFFWVIFVRVKLVVLLVRRLEPTRSQQYVCQERQKGASFIALAYLIPAPRHPRCNDCQACRTGEDRAKGSRH